MRNIPFRVGYSALCGCFSVFWCLQGLLSLLQFAAGEVPFKGVAGLLNSGFGVDLEVQSGGVEQALSITNSHAEIVRPDILA